MNTESTTQGDRDLDEISPDPNDGLCAVCGFPEHHESPRKEFTLRWRDLMSLPGPSFAVCEHCELEKREHINGRFCPEWRLRQLDGDR